MSSFKDFADPSTHPTSVVERQPTPQILGRMINPYDAVSANGAGLGRGYTGEAEV